jgi:hypothetical protein
VLENTLIILSSDNGPECEIPPHGRTPLSKWQPRVVGESGRETVASSEAPAAWSCSAHKPRPLALYPAVSLVSSNPGGLTIIRPETLLRWHRVGFRCYWRWKSRPRGGRPQIETELRALIRRMSIENPLLKLGFDVAQSSVAK